jgi:hypothetical protein
MILFHGSNTEINMIDLSKCRPYKDFGRGFYTTAFREQAGKMALRTVRFFGGTPVITEFFIPDTVFSNSVFRIKRFDKPTTEWALFVTNNRNKNFSNTDDINSNHNNKYDIVMGPVANDDLNLLFNLYLDGVILLEELSRRMEYKELSSQISFHTEQVIKNLQKQGATHE